MPTTLTVESLQAHVGHEVAVSDWIVIDQDRINRFADVTGDDQWIHVDVVRARESRWESTIAHGFLTLSLVAPLVRETVSVAGSSMAVNYGLNRVRFVTPVRAGERVRGRFAVSSVTGVGGGGGVQVIWAVTIELEGSERPAAVAEWIVRYGDASPSSRSPS
ncbi:MAG: MaoC family dehydratase [Acidimicrobiia bacterium]|nr:MaoC family dehydratase [Acidimicrobiia bacterium]